MTSSFRLRLEVLEWRLAPTSLTETYNSSSAYDPTLNPSQPGNTVSALIIAVGGSNGNGGYSVTVAGLSAETLQGAGSIKVLVGNVTTTVTSYSVSEGGSINLVLAETPGLADAVADATTLAVSVGNPAPPPSGGPTTPPPGGGGGVIDPTLHPGGA